MCSLKAAANADPNKSPELSLMCNEYKNLTKNE